MTLHQKSWMIKGTFKAAGKNLTSLDEIKILALKTANDINQF